LLLLLLLSEDFSEVVLFLFQGEEEKTGYLPGGLLPPSVILLLPFASLALQLDLVP
jgi:hypothetical protein